MKEIKNLIIYEKGKITQAEDIFKKILKININYNQENFILFCLDTKNKVLSNKVLFMGGLNACLIDIKTIFKEALLNNSSKIELLNSISETSANFLILIYSSKLKRLVNVATSS